MSNNYYPQFFINTISNFSSRQLGTTTTEVISTLAPVGGTNTMKITTLNTLLQGNLSSVINGTGMFSSFGKTPRSRLLRALGNVQTTGSVVV